MTTTSSVRSSPAPLRILLVDDDDAVRGVIDRLLRRLGHRVQPCASAEEAERAGDEAFEVAVVDLNLGRGLAGDGFGLLERLKARQPDACFVLTSGLRPTIPPPEVGGPLFLKKPFSRSDLVALLEDARAQLQDN